MDLLFEFIFELLLEGSVEISSNKKVSKWIRYPIIFLLAAFFSIIIFGIIIIGILSLKSNLGMGIFFILLGIFFLFGTINNIKKNYVKAKNKKNDTTN